MTTQPQETAMTITQIMSNLTTETLSELTVKTEQGITFPTGYNVKNAITSAMMLIKDAVDKDKNPALGVCTPNSIKQSLWTMANKGLDPNKTHCYFIVYGKTLTCVESYFGLVHRAKMADSRIKDIDAQVVYDGEKINAEYKDGRLVLDYKPDIMKRSNDKMVGAFAVIVYNDGSQKFEYMSMPQIKTSWSKGQQGTNSPQAQFPEEMAKRTVLKRLCKNTVNTENRPLITEENKEFGERFDEEADENEATEMIDVTPEEEPKPMHEDFIFPED
jgi:recombination protein RecT